MEKNIEKNVNKYVYIHVYVHIYTCVCIYIYKTESLFYTPEINITL